ncbi:MAG: N-acetyltransferase [Chloroflexi bacterium]|nr:MAG: N-acetyltransferase [Chloroflexota bacterium]
MSGVQTSFVHPAAEVEDGVQIGAGTRIWALAHVRQGARIGSDCVIGAGVTVDVGVVIGDRCKVQNAAQLYQGLTVGDGVFIGAVTPDGALKSAHDWGVTATFVENGASIGANATVVAGVRIGAWSMVGAGAVVTHDVPEHALVLGVPARQVAWVCRCGAAVKGAGRLRCAACGRELPVSTPD